MSKERLAEKLGFNSETANSFSEEALSEMAMESVEGGESINGYCPTQNKVSQCACNLCNGGGGDY